MALTAFLWWYVLCSTVWWTDLDQADKMKCCDSALSPSLAWVTSFWGTEWNHRMV